MTQVLIDRATLEQLIHGVEMGFDFDDGDVFGVRSNDMTDALAAGRAALANAEPKKVEKVKKREPTIDLGKYAGTYGGYITKEPK